MCVCVYEMLGWGENTRRCVYEYTGRESRITTPASQKGVRLLHCGVSVGVCGGVCVFMFEAKCMRLPVITVISAPVGFAVF